MTKQATSSDSDALVFVYGSLRRGRSQHQQMASCRWVGEAALEGFALYDLGPFPMAVASDETPARLLGEVYAVTTQQLKELDRFEGAPRLYQRIAHPLTDGRLVWLYVGRAHQVRHVRRLPDGEWHGPQPRCC